MPGLTQGLKGRDKLLTIRQHRLDLYCRAYRQLLDGECSLDYFNSRLSKLVEVLPSIKPEGVKVEKAA